MKMMYSMSVKIISTDSSAHQTVKQIILCSHLYILLLWGW